LTHTHETNTSTKRGLELFIVVVQKLLFPSCELCQRRLQIPTFSALFRHGPDHPEFNSQQREKFSFTKMSRHAVGPPSSLLLNGPGVKRPGR